MISCHRRLTAIWGLFLTCVCLTQAGCVLVKAQNAIPVERLPKTLLHGTKDGAVALDLTLLEQAQPPVHIVGPGDVISVFIHGILPAGLDEGAMLGSNGFVDRSYYPPRGNVDPSRFGVPIEVDSHGLLALPLIGKMPVAGLTFEQLEDRIRKSYVSDDIIRADHDRIIVGLTRARTERVLVIREDSTGTMPTTLHKAEVPFSKKGNAQVVDLPIYENDVLHALTATGGLPGIDAENEVWVLRGRTANVSAIQAHLQSGNIPQELVCQWEEDGSVLRIPLRVYPGEPLPFGPKDVVLHDGDIVYVPPRNEFFYTAGLLPGGRIPLPRDEDIDIVEAIALAGGSLGGFSGSGGAAGLRGGGVGSIIPPSLAVIMRKLPDGRQISMRVDLAEAMEDSRQRIVIQPDDVVFLHYTHHELVGNIVLNFFNFNFLIDPSK